MGHSTEPASTENPQNVWSGAGLDIPDRLATDPLIGERYWLVPSGFSADQDLRPFGLYSTACGRLNPWPAFERHQAKCFRPFNMHSKAPRHEFSPFLPCTCGIHAFKPNEKRRWPASGMFSITLYGQVALWGQVLEHERGFRAQYAYPYSLNVLPQPCFTEAHFVRTADRLRRMYGVEVQIADS